MALLLSQRHNVSDQLTDSAVFVQLDLLGESGKPGGCRTHGGY